jgi:small-conductance mechanosensitive channel
MIHRAFAAYPQPTCLLICPGTRALLAAVIVFGLVIAMLIPGLTPPVRAEEQEPEGADVLISAQEMKDSINRALAGNQAELTDLEAQLKQLDTFQAAIRTEIKAFESQNAVHGQLLLATELPIEELEKALSENRLASKSLADRVATFQKSHEAITLMTQASSDRRELARQQIDNIGQSQFSAADKQQLEAKSRKLLQILDNKIRLGDRYLKISEDLLARMTAAVEEKKTIAAQLTAQIESRAKASFFARTDPLRYFKWISVQEAFRSFGGRLGMVFSPITWKAQWSQIKMGGLARWALFLAALAAVLAFQSRCRSYLERVEKQCEGPGWYYRCLGLLLLRRSLAYLGMTILFGAYTFSRSALFGIGLGRLLFELFLVLLITSWGLVYLDHGFSGHLSALRIYVNRRLKRLLLLFRTTTIIYILLRWITGIDSLLAGLAWDIAVTIYLFWLIVFWRQIKPVAAEEAREGRLPPDPKKTALLRGWSYLIVGGGLALSLLGYNSLADHWFAGWISTIVLLFWSWIGLNTIREWHHDHKVEAAAAQEDHIVGSTHPWRWSMIQLVRFVWFFILAAGLLWSWDSGGYLQAQLGRFIGHTVSIGKVSLSIKGILMAVVIVYLTHLGVRLGRALINYQVLEKRSLERGLKDSILTVSSYLGWGLGILLALAVIGVDATSLAVVFGALSVGIGFGLQNIFNNFISGLILLFERPIQVGDYVEVGGLWAEVKKINVRSTVVQTFDNAAVIIPNSEFISQRVTNWSFKDKRMRRHIEVGVAYGSDIDLVEKTLLEVVNARKRVLKFPRPDVIFVDHGASALIFRLRIWVNVDDYWSVPSAIRFDIDNRFRELGIEIAFPQQDIHLRSYPEEFKPPAPATEKT